MSATYSHLGLVIIAFFSTLSTVRGNYREIFDCTFDDDDWCAFRPQSNASTWAVESGELSMSYTNLKADNESDRIFVSESTFESGEYCLKAEHKIHDGARLAIEAAGVNDNQSLLQWNSAVEVTSFSKWTKSVLNLKITSINPFQEGPCEDIGVIDSCEFYGNLCRFTSEGDVYAPEWDSTNGHSSRNVGPETDHTESDNGYYATAEATGYNIGAKSQLYSPWYNVSSSALCIDLWYYMFGTAVGELNIQIIDRNGVITKIWSRYGEQKEQWLEATLKFPITENSEYQVLIETVHGEDELGMEEGYVAMDDYRAEHCNVYSTYKSVSCGFDNNFCQWSYQAMAETPHFLWQRKNSEPDDSNSILGANSCVYTTQASTSDKVTELISPPLFESFCMSFYYLMVVDANNSRLTIYVENESRGGKGAVWRLEGNQVPEWRKARVPIHLKHGEQYKVGIRAVFGDEVRQSVIAVDDIESTEYTDSCLFLPEVASVDEPVSLVDEVPVKQKWIVPVAIGISIGVVLLVLIVLLVLHRKKITDRFGGSKELITPEDAEESSENQRNFSASMYKKEKLQEDNFYEVMPLALENEDECYSYAVSLPNEKHPPPPTSRSLPRTLPETPLELENKQMAALKGFNERNEETVSTDSAYIDFTE